jgi:hypothetical protein
METASPISTIFTCKTTEYYLHFNLAYISLAAELIHKHMPPAFQVIATIRLENISPDSLGTGYLYIFTSHSSLTTSPLFTSLTT